MVQYISKSVVVAEIDRRIEHNTEWKNACKTFAVLAANQAIVEDKKILSIINNLEVIDPYEQHIQYASIESGIKAHAEDYSFNIESKLFNQLTKEQQVMWRKEIEQACISGGYDGVELARDPRYKENLEVKEVDLDAEVERFAKECGYKSAATIDFQFAKHFFKLGLNVSNSLTWEDMMTIHKCIKDAMNFKLYRMMDGIEGQKEVYEEVLKRFKNMKGK